jgi:hypothetical protein
MAACGLRNTEAIRLTGGIAYIYSAER